LQFRIEQAGGVIRRNPRAVVVHPAPAGDFGISLRLQRYNLYNALAFKKHPRRYRRELQAWPPLNYYAMVALVPLFAGLLAARRGPLATGAAAAWGALYLEFLSRRLKGTSHRPWDVLDMAVTSALIPYLAVYWRLRGAVKFRVPFL
jgi:hypothetical protein